MAGTVVQSGCTGTEKNCWELQEEQKTREVKLMENDVFPHNEKSGIFPGITKIGVEGIVPLPEDSGQENDELEWARRHIPEEPMQQLVERKTEITGWGVQGKKKRPVPLATEKMLRKRIRTIMDLQKRMQNEMFLYLNSLQQRIEDIEDQVAVLKKQGWS
jgi:hypothetical protein